MKQTYYELMQKKILAYEIAVEGYKSKMKDLAKVLLEDDEISHAEAIEKIKMLREVLDEVVKDVEIYKAKYHEECEKEATQDAEIH